MVRELSSLEDISDGFILNLYGGETGRIGNTVHPWDWPHVQTMTIPPRKLWAETIGELREWVEARGGELDPITPVCGHANG